jgi:hypothetical protein
VRGRGVAAPALLHALIHPSAWNKNSRKFTLTILYSSRPSGQEILTSPARSRVVADHSELDDPCAPRPHVPTPAYYPGLRAERRSTMPAL